MRILIASLFLLMASCSPTFAQDRVQKITITKTYFCSSHAFVVNDLEKNFGESRKGWAVSVTNELIELFKMKKQVNGQYFLLILIN